MVPSVIWRDIGVKKGLCAGKGLNLLTDRINAAVITGIQLENVRGAIRTMRSGCIAWEERASQGNCCGCLPCSCRTIKKQVRQFARHDELLHYTHIGSQWIHPSTMSVWARIDSSVDGRYFSTLHAASGIDPYQGVSIVILHENLKFPRMFYCIHICAEDTLNHSGLATVSKSCGILGMR